MSAAASNAFEWQSDGETFTFLNIVWNVTEAKRIIASKPRRLDEIEVSEAALLVHRSGASMGQTLPIGPRIDWNRVDGDPAVDLQVPVIVAWVPEADSYLVIDGWHRIAKAIMVSVARLPAVALTRTESRVARIR